MIRRDKVFDDLVSLYRTKSAKLLQQEFHVKFDNERAYDTGGVARDLFSAFWQEARVKLFDGSTVVVPAVTPHSEMVEYCVMGTILSHGYLVSGYIPVDIAFPVLACILKGPLMDIPDRFVLDSFMDYLSTYEADTVRLALNKSEFSQDLSNALVGVLSRFGCRQLPSPANLNSLLVQLARHEMLTIPLRVLHYMHSGVPSTHHSFWGTFSISDLFDLYKLVDMTPSQVIQSISVPDDMNAAQDRVFNYLLCFVGNLKDREDLRKFLRFVTGSSVNIGKTITVSFNNAVGISRRPVAHTCSCEIELPVSYSTSLEFSNEFKIILSSDLAWVMDVV